MSPPTQARGFPRSLQEHSQPQLRQLLTDSSPRFPPPPPSSCLAETFLSQAWSAEPLISSQGTLQGSALAQLSSRQAPTTNPLSLLPSALPVPSLWHMSPSISPGLLLSGPIISFLQARTG